MAPKENAYQPLERSSEDLHDGILLHKYAAMSSGKQRWERIISIFCIISIVISNGVWVGIYNYQRGLQSKEITHLIH